MEAAVARAGLQTVVNQLWRVVQNQPATASGCAGPALTTVVHGIRHGAAAAGLRVTGAVNGRKEAPVVDVGVQHLERGVVLTYCSCEEG